MGKSMLQVYEQNYSDLIRNIDRLKRDVEDQDRRTRDRGDINWSDVGDVSRIDNMVYEIICVIEEIDDGQD